MNYWEPIFPGMTELPGSYCQTIFHPRYYRLTQVDIAIVQQHRFAFYYWLKWAKEAPYKKFITQERPPTLISLDWHRDNRTIQSSEDLEKLNQDDFHDVALFTWFRLNPLNDGHIESAAYLNAIKDIYAVVKQGDQDSTESFNDKFGNPHNFHINKNVDDVIEKLTQSDIEAVYLDIDLDYFIESDDTCGDKVKEIASHEDIFSLLNPSSTLMEWILPRFSGMTIATEPKWCGGLIHSNYFLDGINGTLFDSSLLTPNCYWTHMPPI